MVWGRGAVERSWYRVACVCFCGWQMLHIFCHENICNSLQVVKFRLLFMRGASWFWPAVEAAAVAVVVRLTLVICPSSLRTLPQCAYATLARLTHQLHGQILQFNFETNDETKKIAIKINDARQGQEKRWGEGGKKYKWEINYLCYY